MKSADQQTIMNDTNEQRIQKILAEQLGVLPGAVGPDVSMYDDLGADSLDQIEVMMSIENEFQIEMLDERVMKISTPRELLAYVEELLVERAKKDAARRLLDS